MFGKHLRLKRFLGGIVVTAAVAVVAVPSALSSTSARGGSAPQAQGYLFITDTLGGTRHPVAALQVQPNRFTSDPIADVHGYNPNAYVSGRSTPAAAYATQDLGYARTAAPVQAGGSGGNGNTWRDIGIASLAVLLLVVMFGVLRALRKDEPTVRTA